LSAGKVKEINIPRNASWSIPFRVAEDSTFQVPETENFNTSKDTFLRTQLPFPPLLIRQDS